MSDITRPSPHFKRYTSFGSPVSLIGPDSIKAGDPCRELRATGAGTVTVKRASDNTSHTLDFLDGEKKAYACTEISSVGGGVTAVEVAW